MPQEHSEALRLNSSTGILPAMSNATIDLRSNRLFIALAAFFVANAVIAEFVGVKVFAVEDTLGIAAAHLESVR